MTDRPSLARAWLTVAGLAALLALAHFGTPTGTHVWHVLHLVFAHLYHLPILLAATWLGTRATAAVTAAITLLFGLHVWTDWAGNAFQQADRAAEIVGLWIFTALAMVLMARVRDACVRLQEACQGTLDALASALDLRERETGLHSQRVREYAMMIGRQMGLHGSSLEELAIGALLHDLGKIGVTDRVLLKPGPLDDAEWEQMRRHPDLGADLVARVPFLKAAIPVVSSHHERFDGTGYPRGLAGEAIPSSARIFAVADVLDALTSDRPYRGALSFQQAAEIVRRSRGTHFDPAVVDAFAAIPYAEWRDAAASFGLDLRELPLPDEMESSVGLLVTRPTDHPN